MGLKSSKRTTPTISVILWLGMTSPLMPLMLIPDTRIFLFDQLTVHWRNAWSPFRETSERKQLRCCKKKSIYFSFQYNEFLSSLSSKLQSSLTMVAELRGPIFSSFFSNGSSAPSNSFNRTRDEQNDLVSVVLISSQLSRSKNHPLIHFYKIYGFWYSTKIYCNPFLCLIASKPIDIFPANQKITTFYKEGPDLLSPLFQSIPTPLKLPSFQVSFNWALLSKESSRNLITFQKSPNPCSYLHLFQSKKTQMPATSIRYIRHMKHPHSHLPEVLFRWPWPQNHLTKVCKCNIICPFWTKLLAGKMHVKPDTPLQAARLPQYLISEHGV